MIDAKLGFGEHLGYACRKTANATATLDVTFVTAALAGYMVCTVPRPRIELVFKAAFKVFPTCRKRHLKFLCFHHITSSFLLLLVGDNYAYSIHPLPLSTEFSQHFRGFVPVSLLLEIYLTFLLKPGAEQPRKGGRN